MPGHPLHPAIVHFPIALLLSATAADVAQVAGLTRDAHVAAVLMAGGLAMGLVAMGAGLFDFIRLDQALVPRALAHAGTVGTAWIAYGIALYLRRDIFAGASSVALPSVALSVVSALILAVGGFLGGRLVYTFGAGVSAAPH